MEAGGDHDGPGDQHQQEKHPRHDVQRLHRAVLALAHQAQQRGVFTDLAVGKAVLFPDGIHGPLDVDAVFELHAEGGAVRSVFVRDLTEAFFGQHHAVHVGFEQAAHIGQNARDAVFPAGTVRHGDGHRIAGRKAQLLQSRMVQQCFVGLDGVGPAFQPHFRQGREGVPPGPGKADRVAVDGAAAALAGPSAERHVHAGGDQFGGLAVDARQADVVFAVRFDKVVFLRAQRHIGHAENGRHQQDGKHDADDRNAVAFAVRFLILGDQCKVTVQCTQPPNSCKTPSRT